MEKFLHVGFIIGLLLSLSKLSELMFSLKQKKYIQDKFEIFTIWLDDVKPNKWSRFLENDKVQLCFLTIGFLQTFAACYPLFEMLPSKLLSDSVLLVTYITFFLEGLLYILLFRKQLKKIITKMIFPKIGKLIYFLLWFIALNVLFFIIGFLGGAIFIDFALDNNPLYIETAIGIMALTFSTITVIAFTLEVAWLSFLFYVLLVLLSFVLKIAKSIAWRISEYNKGVIEAIVLIGTVVLGIIEAVHKIL